MIKKQDTCDHFFDPQNHPHILSEKTCHSLRLHWDAPPWIKSGITTRQGGISAGLYRGFNIDDRNDDPEKVKHHRELLATQSGFPSENFVWLDQVHGSHVVCADDHLKSKTPCIADASFSKQPGTVCVVMTADCLPILLASRTQPWVAAIHGGWKSLASGIISQTIQSYRDHPSDLLAYLGPAIGPFHFVVQDDVKQAFSSIPEAFKQSSQSENNTLKWHANLYTIAKMQLLQSGVTCQYGKERCTYQNPDLFYSYRRDGAQTGRMASWIGIALPHDPSPST